MKRLPTCRKTDYRMKRLPTCRKTDCRMKRLPTCRKTDCRMKRLWTCRMTDYRMKRLRTCRKTDYRMKRLPTCRKTDCRMNRLRTCRKTDYRMKRLRTCRKTDCRMNEWIFFELLENPRRKYLHNYRLQELACDMWWGRKTAIRIGPSLSTNYVTTTWSCGGTHVHLYCVLAEPWYPVATFCSFIKAKYISAQSLQMLISGLNSFHIYFTVPGSGITHIVSSWIFWEIEVPIPPHVYWYPLVSVVAHFASSLAQNRLGMLLSPVYLNHPQSDLLY
jgi:hypothetical protein